MGFIEIEFWNGTLNETVKRLDKETFQIFQFKIILKYDFNILDILSFLSIFSLSLYFLSFLSIFSIFSLFYLTCPLTGNCLKLRLLKFSKLIRGHVLKEWESFHFKKRPELDSFYNKTYHHKKNFSNSPPTHLLNSKNDADKQIFTKPYFIKFINWKKTEIPLTYHIKMS